MTSKANRSDKIVSLFVQSKSGEGRGVLLLASSLFLIMVAAYLLKPVREMLILTQRGSEVRSYALALQAVLLTAIIPLYSHYSRKLDKLAFMRSVYSFLALNLALFYILGKLGITLSVVFFVWLGAFGTIVLAQYWAFVSDLYSHEAGKRLVAAIAIGATAGSLFGSFIAHPMSELMGPYELILMATFVLLAALIPISYAEKNIPINSQIVPAKQVSKEEPPSLHRGFNLVLKSRYLLALAIFVILFNWANSMGEYLLSRLVEFMYEQETTTLTKTAFIGQFYANFYFYVNLVGFIIQAFFVSGVLKRLGLRIALLITPILMTLSYGFLSVWPIIAVFKLTKIGENSLDYSLQNTVKQVLYLPLSKIEKYEARAVIDTLCWRLGDLLQAITVFIGLNLLQIKAAKFAILNAVVCLVLILLAYEIGTQYAATPSANEN